MVTRLNQSDYVKTALRLPPDVHAKIHAAAETSGRSYNAEIVARLQATFEQGDADEAGAKANRQGDALFYEILDAQLQLQQATMALSEAKDEAFHVAAKLQFAEQDFRDAEERGAMEALVSVRKDKVHRLQKELKRAQQAVIAAKDEFSKRQEKLSALHAQRRVELDVLVRGRPVRLTRHADGSTESTPLPASEATGLKKRIKSG